ncbi:ABC transporter substrate-binding protein [Nocardia salmonicida]|uniref:ABC transporter substrate-binding protein n=1 Tax=Nocardia salmonicida TaxID=53431 RepID=UPI003641808A
MSAENEHTPPARRAGRTLRRGRRRWIAAGAVFAVVAASGALYAARSGSAQTSADVPVRRGTLVYGIAGTQPSLDPAGQATGVTSQIGRNIFDSLIAQTGPDTFGPWLATDWTVSPDGLVYSFTLRDGVTFHDGTPFTADAVKATLEHAVDPQTKSSYAASFLATYRETRIINAHEVEIVLKEPFTPLLQALSTPNLAIQSAQALALPAADYRPVGTGPFVFEHWEPGKRETLVRATKYTSAPEGAAHTGPAYLDKLVFELIAEDATRLGALTSGQLHGIDSVAPVSAGQLSRQAGFTLRSNETPGLNYSLFLNQSRGPLQDQAVRHALAAALDIPKLVDNVYFGRYPVADNPISRTTAAYDATTRKELVAYDPAAAERQLDSAGWNTRDADGYRVKNGARLSLVWPLWTEGSREQRAVIADGIQVQARAVGIEIVRPTVDTGTYIERYLTGGAYDIIDGNSSSPSPDVLRFAFLSTNTFANGGSNVARLNSPQVDAWLAQATAAGDPAQAAALYSRVQHEVLRQIAIVPVYNPVSLTAFADTVRDLEFDIQTYPRFYDTWLAA